MKRLLVELSGYGAASAVALAVDMALLWALAHLGMNYLTAATLSFVAGAFVAYSLSIRIAFRSHRLRDRRLELFWFVTIGAVALLINATVIGTCVHLLGLHYMVGKCVAAGWTFTFNFVARRQLLFVSRSES